jgi:hypothetical protein
VNPGELVQWAGRVLPHIFVMIAIENFCATDS